MDAFATGYCYFSDAMMRHLREICRDPNTLELDPARLAEAVAIIQGIAPQSEAEAMLAVQMVAIQNATMMAAGQLATAQFREHHHWAASSLSKCARTFAMQMEALKNFRLNGTQHIHVYHHRPEAPASPGGIENGSQCYEPGRPNERSSKVLSEVKAIAAGLPRPSNARS
jgi:hypothetical protein